MRVKIIDSWAHLFAFANRLTGRPLAWSPTGGVNGRSSRRLRLVLTLLVGWPLVTFALVVAGAATHMGSLGNVDYWPPLVASAVYTLAAVLVLQPLGETRWIVPVVEPEVAPLSAAA